MMALTKWYLIVKKIYMYSNRKNTQITCTIFVIVLKKSKLNPIKLGKGMQEAKLNLNPPHCYALSNLTHS